MTNPTYNADLLEARRLLTQAQEILDRYIESGEYVCDLPPADLSHLSVRRAIQAWLEMLPGKRTASPAEIKLGLKDSRPSKTDNQDTIQQSIYELWKERKIRKDGWGQYGALV
jgi:hypothetical protein